MKPTIIKESSNFVFVTYWWGRGNLNKNTARPCPGELYEKHYATAKNKSPITYEKMINRWESSCKRQKCNYMAVEVPKFAKKGGYQEGINYKPTFIREALKACAPRAVVYIDGDMLVNKYPGLFDLKNIDFMARQWHIDQRQFADLHKSGEQIPCFDPYVIETSGGIMYFGNTPKARELLDLWATKSALPRHKGQADDRILSYYFNMNKLLSSISFVALPNEYLWLNLENDIFMDKKFYDAKNILVSHPECLTPEDTATSQGAASDRYPKRYDKVVAALWECYQGEHIMYECIHFPNKRVAKRHEGYNRWVESVGYYEAIVPYDEGYGSRNKNHDRHKRLMKGIKTKAAKTVYISHESYGLKDEHICSKELLLSSILKYLMEGKCVYYLPNAKTKRSLATVKKKAEKGNDFVARNANNNTYYIKREYLLDLDTNYPMFFRENDTLIHLMKLSEDLNDMGSIFNASPDFIHRIRVDWVMGEKTKLTTIKKTGKVSITKPKGKMSGGIRTVQPHHRILAAGRSRMTGGGRGASKPAPKKKASTTHLTVNESGLVPDKLCIVAHPDDEVLWGGANLLAEPGWKVVMATNKKNEARNHEAHRTMVKAGVWELVIFNCRDTDDEDADTISICEFNNYLRELAKQKWKLVLTHNTAGEYGHAQHIIVGNLVAKHFKNAKRFGADKMLHRELLARKAGLNQYYAETQNISRMIYNDEVDNLRRDEYDHYAKEKLYLTPKGESIPKIIHQMWIGGKMPPYKNVFINSVRDWCKRHGWHHILWTNSSLNKEMLPNTWKYIEKAKAVQKTTSQNKYSQISDLMRYELLCRYGGYYMDSNMEIVGDFESAHRDMVKAGARFVGSNEDPCNLNCKSNTGRKYLSNGFFGTVAGGEVILNTISPRFLNGINFKSEFINRESGPYYLRKCIEHPRKYKVKLIPTKKVYPFNANENDYRPAEKSKCLSTKKSEKFPYELTYYGNKLYLQTPCKEYRGAILMNHFLGGSWDYTT